MKTVLSILMSSAIICVMSTNTYCQSGVSNTTAQKAEEVDTSTIMLIKQMNETLSGKEIWINERVYPVYWQNSKYEKDKFPAVLMRHYDNRYTIEYAYPRPCEWFRKYSKGLWTGIIGDEEIIYEKLLFLGIEEHDFWISDEIKRNRTETEAKRYCQKWYFGAPRMYYAKFIPSPERDYQMGESTSYILKGSDIKDTLFIPFHRDFMSNVYSEKEVEKIESEFTAAVRKAWKDYTNNYKTKRQTLSKIYGSEAADLICGGRVQFGFTVEMCKLALEGEPFQISYFVTTPVGLATCYYFYTQNIKLYFIDGILIGIAWKDEAIRYHV